MRASVVLREGWRTAGYEGFCNAPRGCRSALYDGFCICFVLCAFEGFWYTTVLSVSSVRRAALQECPI